MQVHIFRGSGRIFGSTEDLTGTNLPLQYGPWTLFKTISLSQDGAPIPGIDTAERLDDIEKHGFHITDAHIRITQTAI